MPTDFNVASEEGVCILQAAHQFMSHTKHCVVMLAASMACVAQPLAILPAPFHFMEAHGVSRKSTRVKDAWVLLWWCERHGGARGRQVTTHPAPPAPCRLIKCVL